MKKHLINLWFDLYDMRAVGKENVEAKRTNIARIESILWERCRYDIALTHKLN